MWCDCGPGWVTTGGPCTCTGPPSRWWRSSVAVLPDDEASLRSLPGIGPSTARAVLSFGFGVDVATVDTNVVRVLSRCVLGAPLPLPEAQSLADRLLPPGHSWEFNQTMFDVGATLCVGTNPGCGECPLRAMCVGTVRHGRTGSVAGQPFGAAPVAFAGSDRQGRGRLLQALRLGPVACRRGRIVWLARRWERALGSPRLWWTRASPNG